MTTPAVIACLAILIIIGAIKYDLTKKQVIYLFIVICLIPIWWRQRITTESMLQLLILTGGWAGYLLIKNGIIKLVLLFALTGLSVYFVLADASILNGTSFNRERTFWVDNKNDLVLQRFKEESLFLPYSIRGIVWGEWWQGYEIFLKSFEGITGNVLWSTTGIALWVLAVISLLKKTNAEIFMAVWATIAAGWMGRNPNLSMIGIFLIPPILAMGIGVTKKLDIRGMIATIFLTIPFIF